MSKNIPFIINVKTITKEEVERRLGNAFSNLNTNTLGEIVPPINKPSPIDFGIETESLPETPNKYKQQQSPTFTIPKLPYRESNSNRIIQYKSQYENYNFKRPLSHESTFWKLPKK